MSPRLIPPHLVGKPYTNSPPSSIVTILYEERHARNDHRCAYALMRGAYEGWLSYTIADRGFAALFGDDSRLRRSHIVLPILSSGPSCVWVIPPRVSGSTSGPSRGAPPLGMSPRLIPPHSVGISPYVTRLPQVLLQFSVLLSNDIGTLNSMN